MCSTCYDSGCPCCEDDYTQEEMELREDEYWDWKMEAEREGEY